MEEVAESSDVLNMLSVIDKNIVIIIIIVIISIVVVFIAQSAANVWLCEPCVFNP